MARGPGLPSGVVKPTIPIGAMAILFLTCTLLILIGSNNFGYAMKCVFPFANNKIKYSNLYYSDISKIDAKIQVAGPTIRS
jgi:hypothetical protein